MAASVMALPANAAPLTRAALRTSGRATTTIVLSNEAGLKWELLRTTNGWALGTLSLHAKPVEQSATNGWLALRNVNSGEVRWLAAAQGEKGGPRTARFSGQHKVARVKLSWAVDMALHDDLPVASFPPKWSVDKALDGWEVRLAFYDAFTNDWRVQSYPWAANSEEAAITPMRYCGVPGVLMYRPDLSLVVLFAIESHSDYLNPNTWTGRTGFHFANRRLAPQFRCGGGSLIPGTKYAIYTPSSDVFSAKNAQDREWLTIDKDL